MLNNLANSMSPKFEQIVGLATKEGGSLLQIRSDLMIAIRDIIKEKKWSQTEAAAQIGLTQPRISDLVNGHAGKFSIDKLIECLCRLGFRFHPKYINGQLSMEVEIVKDEEQ